MRILIGGASGLIGTELQRVLEADGHDVRVLVRRTPRRDGGHPFEYEWHPERSGVDRNANDQNATSQIAIDQNAIEWADAVVGLSGASLSRLPWTRRYREQIIGSRVAATTTLARAISSAKHPPSVWVNGSAVGFYGNRPGEVLTENSARGEGFLSDVVAAWERACALSTSSAAASSATTPTRIVCARTGLVLARKGALSPLILATRFGLGGTIGTGRQHWPWVSLTDEALAIAHLATISTLEGPVNIVGPTPATASDITRTLAAQLHRPHLTRLPAWLLRTAMGSAADELLLADQLVEPSRLTADGFVFTANTATDALRAI